jgi:tetratricopeptide (TPR) repeat protein
MARTIEHLPGFVEQFKRMKVVVVVAALAALVVSNPLAAAAQQGRGERTSEAYTQFMLGHYLDERDDEAGAIAAYKRAMELDPTSAEIPGELAAVYLRENKIQEAMTTAEQALKIAPTNREGNRVLGVIHAALAESGRGGRSRGAVAGGSAANDENVAKAIKHLEAAMVGVIGEVDPNVRATLSRVYVLAGQYDKAIPLLSALVEEQPGWADGPSLLAEAYAAAGRNAEAIDWLKEHAADDPRLYPTLADFFERERRWKEAADAYGRTVQLQQQRGRAPTAELQARYANALIYAGGRDNLLKAREVLSGLTASPSGDLPRLLYLQSQTERRLGDSKAAESTARKVIAQNAKSPWGYYALAEALESRHDYQGVVNELSPVVSQFQGRSADPSFDIGLLLPHLGFAYQELGQHDQAIAAFENARKLAPKDPAVASYLAEANIAAKRYAAAAEVAKTGLTANPGDLRLTRLQARALRLTGKADEGVALLEESVRKNAGDPNAYIALAQMYGDVDRGAQAVETLRTAQAKFPDDTTIAFELAATFDKQKRYADAEAAFKQLLTNDPENAAALNYLGYMLAERGERLDESVNYVKKALELEPENGSYLDSLGWAYFKADKLDLAEDTLKRAAEQLKTNSVIQDHYGEVLLKLGRYEEAIAAFNRALAGDGDSINRAEIDRKIRAARQKQTKK